VTEGLFVARERELGQLLGFLRQALAGLGQVCFLTGEAGSGKTALLSEFARRAEEVDDEVLVAIGSCNAQTGIGEPYFPFREVLGMLTGDVEGQLSRKATTRENAHRLRAFVRLSGQALVELGPDLIGVFVPFAGLAARAAAFILGRAGWLDGLERLAKRKARASEDLEQGHIFRQYTNVLQALAEKRPLVLLLDDLQWADAASTEMLFHLGQSIAQNRILITGAYRPEEVALGRDAKRHPLEKVLNECKRYLGDVWVDLDWTDEAEGKRFVDAFLDTEPNRLGERFRQARYEHTEGHPLFTIELLRDMQERGDIIHDEEGQWVEGPELDWKALPVRVEGVIEERIGRLEEELRETLSIACVEGEDFTAQVIARVQEVRERQLLRKLSHHLERRHRLVREGGARRVGCQILDRYRFVHGLFQQYLYSELGAGERRLLHRDIASVLEELYEGRTEEITVQLARHYTEAQERDKAAHYLGRAGKQAAAMFANIEAVSYFSRALDLTAEEDQPARAALHLELGKALMTLGEYDEALEHLMTAHHLLCDISDEVAVLQRARACFFVGRIYQQMGGGANLTAGLHWQDRGLALLPERPTAEAATLHASGGLVKLHQGDFNGAVEKGKLALSIAKRTSSESEEALAHRLLSVAFRAQGLLDQAMRHACGNLRICNELSDLTGLAKGYSNLGVLAFEKDRWRLAEKLYLRTLPAVKRIGDEFELARVCLNLGDLYFHLGEIEDGLSNARRSLDRFTDVNSIQGGILARVLQATLLWRQGNLEEAVEKLLEAQELAQENEVVMFRPTVGRWLAQVYLTAGDVGRAEAELEDLLRLDTDILADDSDPIQRLRGQVLAGHGQASRQGRAGIPCSASAVCVVPSGFHRPALFSSSCNAGSRRFSSRTVAMRDCQFVSAFRRQYRARACLR
jgi:tetratricopeptide (TPR) repeat protein